MNSFEQMEAVIAQRRAEAAGRLIHLLSVREGH